MALISSIHEKNCATAHSLNAYEGIQFHSLVTDLLNYLKENDHNIPVATISGLEPNNVKMMNLGATIKCSKQGFLAGELDENLLKLKEEID